MLKRRNGSPAFTSNERKCSLDDIGLNHSEKVTWCEKENAFICKECCIKRAGHNCEWWILCFGESHG